MKGSFKSVLKSWKKCKKYTMISTNYGRKSSFSASKIGVNVSKSAGKKKWWEKQRKKSFRKEIFSKSNRSNSRWSMRLCRISPISSRKYLTLQSSKKKSLNLVSAGPLKFWIETTSIESVLLTINFKIGKVPWRTLSNSNKSQQFLFFSIFYPIMSFLIIFQLRNNLDFKFINRLTSL